MRLPARCLWCVSLMFCAAVIWLVCAGPVGAHEIGTTRVSVLFPEDGTYDIELVTDAGALVEKLLAAANPSTAGDIPANSIDSLLRRFDQTFRERAKIVFDASEVRPAISYGVSPRTDALSAAVATIRLTGRIPPGAHQFSWAYGWTFASYALTVRKATSEKPTTEWLEGDQRSTPLVLALTAPPVNRLRIAWRYLTLGFTHILPNGLDHMLFVLGIYLLSGRARSVILQVSAFTIAHSITLGLSLYGIVTLSPRIVEPLIAISIAYVAIENLFLSELKAQRVALVFAFGLLHGMGFAGALKELGLPRSEFVTALLTFNVGVEAGQLAVIGAAWMLFGLHWSHRAWYRSRIAVPASLLIACTAIYWTIERLS